MFKVGINDVVAAGYSCKGREFRLWQAMMSRCFSEYTKRVRPTYEGVTCQESWKTFSLFIKDVSSMKGFDKMLTDGWVLDKDILVKGNKIYSEETCCFVPKEINGCFTLRKLHRGDYPVGVRKCSRSGKYVARCGYDGRRRNLGYFTNVMEAFLAYKDCKEKEVKRLADKYKGLIDDSVYEALYNYEVEIDD